MPMPRRLPRFAASARRASKPAQSMVFSAGIQHDAGNRRCRRSCPPACCAASPSGGTMLRRRNSTRSMLHLARRGVDQPLDQVVALRPPGAAIGVDRHGVGEHADDVGVDRLEAVDAGQHAGARHGRDRPARRSTDRRPCWRRCGCAAPGTCRRRRAPVSPSGDVVAALRVGQERLAALRRPFHRAAELARGVAGQHVLGIQEQLHAEAAADIRRDDAELLRRRP